MPVTWATEIAAPQLLPGMTSLNGLAAAMVVHLAGYYLLEETGVLPGHEVAEDAETI